ncbi:hypothetical protein [Sorangium sp. So ce861]|uniref:hypothetical protein n=1 Tax=Sorangium sp. So ce861 TaxID=3133323 RepID=UPI003F5DD75B
MLFRVMTPLSEMHQQVTTLTPRTALERRGRDASCRGKDPRQRVTAPFQANPAESKQLGDAGREFPT